MIGIDLGSNTIRIVKIDCHTTQKLGEYEKIVRTADKLVQTGKISDEAVERIINAINEAKQKIDFNDEINAVATEAMRRAKNSDEVIKRIKDATGIEFKIITPEEEATLTALAVENCLEKKCNIEAKSFFLVDIGGGSTELILKHKDTIISQSFPLGIVTFTQKYKTPEAIKYAVKKEAKKFRDFIDLSLIHI